MIKCPFCGVDSFLTLLGLQDHLDIGLEKGCVNWCAKCNKERPTKIQLESFIIGGGADSDYPKTCPHVV